MKGIKKVISYVWNGNEQRRGLVVLRQRELEILKLVARGMTNRVIAEELRIGERTVQTHLFNIFRKLEARSRAEAVSRAVREGWLTTDDLPSR